MDLKKQFRKKKDGSLLDKRSGLEYALFAVVFIIFAIYAISLIYPFIWLILSSFKESTEYILDISQGRPFDLPDGLCWYNYQYALSEMNLNGTNFIGMFFNSVWYSGLSTLLGVFACTCTGYILSRFQFPGRNLIYSIAIITMTVPIVGSTGGTFKLVSNLGIYNSPLYVIFISLGGFGMPFMVFYGFFKNISWSYAEAVYIDGGGDATVFFRIMLPQATPVIISLFVVSFITAWNNYETTLMYLPSYPTIASGMYNIKNTLVRTGKDVIYFAGIIISVIPIIALFSALSDTIMNNMTVGGLKG